MTASRKCRWLLLTAVVGVVAGAVGFIVVRRRSKEDLPRLVVLREEGSNTQRVVVFRFDAPKHRAVQIMTPSTKDPYAKVERKAVWTIDAPRVEAGQSTRLTVLTPVQKVWRLRCVVRFEDTAMTGALHRARWCWLNHSFAPWSFRTFETPGLVESDFITNAVPSTAEPNRP